jgi:serine/threonine protein kinase
MEYAKRIGKYVVFTEGLIEGGGFGKVYKCRKDGEDIFYACKVIPKETVLKQYNGKTHEECLQMVQREIDLNRRLTH